MKYLTKAVILTFVLGLLVGGVTMKLVAHRLFFHPMMGEHRQDHMLNRLSSKLKLSPEQKEKVGAILTTAHQQMEALSKETGPKFEAIRNSTSDQIRSVLTPEQLTKFNEMHEKFDRKAKEAHGMMIHDH
jgi:Spy/CpxP family protein refolding chaperone